jgi:hypothetical protein
MSPEGYAKAKRTHDKEHCVHCPTCGQPIAIKQNIYKESYTVSGIMPPQDKGRK